MSSENVRSAEGENMVDENKKRTIAFLLYPGLTPLDLVGPLAVLQKMAEFDPRYETVVVAERLEPAEGDNGMRFIPNKTFEEMPHPYAIVVPGGSTPTLRAMKNPAIRKYVLQAAGTAEAVASVCTGALILASVGLLEGVQATTHWAYYGVLNALGARYVRERWVENGKVINSAGVSAGIDMALKLVARLSGEETARKVQLWIDYDPQPPFGNLDYDRLPFLPRAVRAYYTLSAPFIVSGVKRLNRAGL
jgi:transcriptional regulator GlxA family with amidase domain